MRKNFTRWLFPVLFILQACSKDDVITAPVLQPAKGIYVLSEGGFGANNSKLAYRSVVSGVVAGDFFLQQNPGQTGGLGDLGNDMILYGSKLYIVMNGSSNVTVLNAASGTYITKIPFVNGTSDKSPRYAVGAKGKVFVTAYDNSVSVIDTTTLAITNTITVGSNPEGIATTGNYLYVANSGGLNYPAVDSTVSVIDLTTLTEIKKITVGKSPNKIAVNSAGNVYVSCFGIFGSVDPSVAVISSTSNTLSSILPAGFQYTHVRIYEDVAYFYNTYGDPKVGVYNTLTGILARDNFITDGTSITSTYGVNIDEQNGDVYISDAKDYVSSGEVTCFDKTGRRKFSFSVAPGVNPNTVLFVR